MLNIPTGHEAKIEIEREILKRYVNLNESAQDVNLLMKIEKKTKSLKVVDCQEFLINKSKDVKK